MEKMAAPALLMAAVIGIPLAVAPGVMLENDVTPKLVILLSCTAGLVLCWNIWWRGTAILRSKIGLVFAGLLGLQALSLIISTAFSQQPELSLAGSAWRRFGLVTQLSLILFAFLTACITTRSRRTAKFVLVGLVCSSALISAYAVMQYAHWDPLFRPYLYSDAYYGALLRVPGTLGHAMYLGAFLSATLPITLGLAAEAVGRVRLALLAAAGLCAIAIVLSGSRTSLLALIAAALTYLRTGGKVGARQAWTAVGGITALVVAVLIFVQLPSGRPLLLRLGQWRQDFYGGPRLMMWRDSLALIRIRPAIGSGLETFANEFRRLQSAELSRAYPDFYQESPHNLLIETSVAQGLPGLLILAGLACVAVAGRSARREIACLRASAAATLVSLLFVPVTIIGALLLYLAIALVVPRRLRPGSQRAGVAQDSLNYRRVLQRSSY